MNRQDNQEQRRDFEFYMGLDPEKSRHFIENKCMSIAIELFMNAQKLELLSRKLQ